MTMLQPAGVLGDTGLRSPALAGAARASVVLYPLVPYVRPGRSLVAGGVQPTAAHLVDADDLELVRAAFVRLHDIYELLAPPTIGAVAIRGLGELDALVVVLGGISAMLLAAAPDVLAQVAPSLRLDAPSERISAPPTLELRRVLEHMVGEYMRVLADDLVVEQRPSSRPRCRVCLHKQPPLITTILRPDGTQIEYLSCEACGMCGRTSTLDLNKRRPRRGVLYDAIRRMTPYVLPHVAKSVRDAAPSQGARRVSGSDVGERLALKRRLDEEENAILSATTRTAVDLARHLHQTILALPVPRHLLPPLPTEDAMLALVRAAERTA